ncbi:transposase [Arthrobacter sp. CAN_A212]|uniref:transposase n=1 Tax=Arthrobacter sp. CAN_A212 TaxID=2787719 RepID=UPI003FA435ED
MVDWSRMVEVVNKVLADVNSRFPTATSFFDHLEVTRWPDGATCPYCTSQRSTPLPKEGRHHCNYCNSSYSVTTGTFLSGTRVDLRKWLAAVVIVLSEDYTQSTARNLAATLSINKNTACRMSRLIQIARHTDARFLASMNLIVSEKRFP